MTAAAVIPQAPVRAYPLPERPPRFSFIAGTYGDAIAALGLHQHLLRSLGRESGPVLYYGPDTGVAEWLRVQPMVDSVTDVRSPGPVTGIPTDPARLSEWVPAWSRLTRFSVRAREVWPCHVDFTLRERLPVHRPELRTEKHLEAWARAFVKCQQGAPIVCLQPRSETSCLWERHWPCWGEAVRWLLAETDATLIFCGKGAFKGDLFGRHPRIVDLVNNTPTMPHLFALAEQCDVIVSTCNALGLYAASKGVPAVVCGNTTHRRPEQFFTRFISAPTTGWVEHWEGLELFKRRWAEVAKW